MGLSDSAPVRAASSRPDPGPEPAGESEQELVERARSDPEAFAELYRRHVRSIHAFAYRRSRSKEVAEEVTSSTFERALRALPSFRWRDGGFGAWLHRIAANELATYYRRSARQRSARGQRAAQHLVEAATVHDGERDADVDELVLKALGTLNERYQQVISLRYLAGLSADEAAEAMGLPKARLAVVLHRALAALRRAMDDLGAPR
jgi:RNA polymerase sigma-70 factor (ECF subfamily)